MDNGIGWIFFPFLALLGTVMAAIAGQTVHSVDPHNGIRFNPPSKASPPVESTPFDSPLKGFFTPNSSSSYNDPYSNP